MRRTAERVDEQLLTEMQAKAIPGPWAAGDRVLVCISEDPRAAGLVRYAKRIADRLHAPWTAIYCRDRAAARGLANEQRDRIADTLRLAMSLGGETITIPGGGRSIADDVIGYARANNITQIIIGKSTRSRWFEILHGSVVHDLVRRDRQSISVHVIAGEDVAGEPIPKKTVRTAERRRAIRSASLCHRARCCRHCALRSARSIEPWFGIENVDLVFLTAVVGVAARFGLWPSLLRQRRRRRCAIISFFCRRSTLSRSPIRTTSLAFFFFIVMAVIVSNVAARVRTQAVDRDGRARARPNRSMPSAASWPASARSTMSFGPPPTRRAMMLKVRVVLLLPEDGSIAVEAGYPPEDILDRRRSGRGEMGLAEQSAGRARLGYVARRQAAVPAHAHWPRRDRRGRHRQRQAGAAAHARRAAAARCAHRPGRAGDRARASGRGHGSGQAHGRDRALAFGAADVDLARSQDAACRGTWRGRARCGIFRRQAQRQRRRPICWRRSSTSRSGSIGSSPICST